jgi:hypothetical protein
LKPPKPILAATIVGKIPRPARLSPDFHSAKGLRKFALAITRLPSHAKTRAPLAFCKNPLPGLH